MSDELKTTLDYVAIIIFFGTYAREHAPLGYDGASIECACCGRTFIVGRVIHTVSLSVLHGTVKRRVMDRVRANKQRAAGVRASACATCAERVR